MADQHIDKDEAEIAEIMARLAELPPHKLQWFVKQMIAMQDGKPNAIQGTAPIPDWWPELEGYAHV